MDASLYDVCFRDYMVSPFVSAILKDTYRLDESTILSMGFIFLCRGGNFREASLGRELGETYHQQGSLLDFNDGKYGRYFCLFKPLFWRSL